MQREESAYNSALYVPRVSSERSLREFIDREPPSIERGPPLGRMNVYVLGGVGGAGKSCIGEAICDTLRKASPAQHVPVVVKIGPDDWKKPQPVAEILKKLVDETEAWLRHTFDQGKGGQRYFHNFHDFYDHGISVEESDKLRERRLPVSMKSFQKVFKTAAVTGAILIAVLKFGATLPVVQSVVTAIEAALPVPSDYVILAFTIVSALFGWLAPWMFTRVTEWRYARRGETKRFRAIIGQKPQDFRDRASQDQRDKPLLGDDVLINAFKFDLDRTIRQARPDTNVVVPIFIDVDRLGDGHGSPDDLRALIDKLATPFLDIGKSAPESDVLVDYGQGVRLVVVSKQYRRLFTDGGTTTRNVVRFMTDKEAKMSIFRRLAAAPDLLEAGVAADVREYLRRLIAPKDGAGTPSLSQPRLAERIVGMLAYGADGDLEISLAESIRRRTVWFIAHYRHSKWPNPGPETSQLLADLRQKLANTADAARRRLFGQLDENAAAVTPTERTASYLAAFTGIPIDRIPPLPDDYLRLADFRLRETLLAPITHLNGRDFYLLTDEVRETMRQHDRHLADAEAGLSATFELLAGPAILGLDGPITSDSSLITHDSLEDYALALDCIEAFAVSRTLRSWNTERITSLIRRVDALCSSEPEPSSERMSRRTGMILGLRKKLVRICARLFAPLVHHGDDNNPGVRIIEILNVPALAVPALRVLAGIQPGADFDARMAAELRDAADFLTRAARGPASLSTDVVDAAAGACRAVKQLHARSVEAEEPLSSHPVVARLTDIYRNRRQESIARQIVAISDAKMEISSLDAPDADAALSVIRKIISSVTSVRLREAARASARGDEPFDAAVARIESEGPGVLVSCVENLAAADANFAARADWYIVRSYLYWQGEVERSGVHAGADMAAHLTHINGVVDGRIGKIAQVFADLPAGTQNLIIGTDPDSPFRKLVGSAPTDRLATLLKIIDLWPVPADDPAFENKVDFLSSLIGTLRSRAEITQTIGLLHKTIAALAARADARSANPDGRMEATRLRAFAVALTKGLDPEHLAGALGDVRQRYIGDVFFHMEHKRGRPLPDRSEARAAAVARFRTFSWKKRGDLAAALTHCLATANPDNGNSYPGDLIVFEKASLKAAVAQISEEAESEDGGAKGLYGVLSQEHLSLTALYTDLPFRWAGGLIPTIIFNWLTGRPVDDKGQIITELPHILTNGLSGKHGSARPVSGRGEEFVANIFDVLFPLADGNTLPAPDDAAEPFVWLGASNSMACVKARGFDQNALLANGGALVEELRLITSLRRMVVFRKADAGLSGEDAEDFEIRHFVNDVYEEAQINFEDDGELIVTLEAPNADPRKNRTFLSMFYKVFGRPVEILGFDPDLQRPSQAA